MASTNAEKNIYSEIGDGYTNISFVKDEHDYGKINFNSERTSDSVDRCSVCHGKCRVVIIVTLVIIIVAAVVVPVVIVFSNGGIHNKNKGLQTSATTSTSVSGDSSAKPTGSPTTAKTSSGVTVGSTSQATTPKPSYSWGEWTECTVTCGQGFHTRYRSCISTESNCDYVQTDVCEETTCSTIGRWITWSQWGNCDATCGGGRQTRSRSCSKNNTSDIDCVGDSLQTSVCNDWKCPDCSQTCDVGTLNGECTACVCHNRTVTGRIRSLTTGNAISSAAVYNIAAPTSILGLSNDTGHFILADMCNKSELLITREGFVNEKIIINGSFVEIQMTRAVLPFFVQSPLSKVRLTGENVTLCCQAEGSPNVKYYEWFKDSVLIDQMEGVNQSFIHLTNLSSDDSGYYQCRANSEIGAVKSIAAKLVVKAIPSDFCKDALQQKKIALPEDCVQPDTNTSLFEVGECVPKSCRSNYTEDKEQCTDGVDSCCSAAETRVETVYCKDYSLEVIVVQSCSCSQCFQEELLIVGGVTGMGTDTPIQFCNVSVNGKLETYTDTDGLYEVYISKNTNRFILTVVDQNDQYLPTTKVIDIANNVDSRLRVDMKLFKAAEPVIIDSIQENKLFAGTIGNSSSPKIEVKLPANSFYFSNGSAYSGLVKAMLTYLDPTTALDFESIPGVFQYTNEEGELGNLDTLGVFNLYVEDTNGQKLEIADPVEAYIPDGIDVAYSDFKLWTLNPQSGIWEDTSLIQSFEGNSRSKRDTARLIGQFNDVSQKMWYNYDRVSTLSSNICYFKICLFEDASLSQKLNSAYRRISLFTRIKRGNILHTIKHYFSDTRNTIINVVCENDRALITADSYDTIYFTEPSPNTPTDFELASDAKSLIISLQRSVGPFHSTSSFSDDTCLNLYYKKNTFEWRHIPTLVKKEELKDLCRSIRAADLYKYWYPLNNKQYVACYVKVKVQLNDGIIFSRSDKVKIRVLSSVKNLSNLKETIIGIMESEIDLVANRETTKCIEYRCSGVSDPCNTTNRYETKVKIFIEESRSNVIFSVAQYKTDLKPLVQVNETFQFTAPLHDGPLYGLYSAADANVDAAREAAQRYCSSSIDTQSSENQPNEGLAVGFQGKWSVD